MTKKTLVAAGGALLILLFYLAPFTSSSDAPRPKLDFKTAEVQKGKLTIKIAAKGVVEPNFQVEVKSKASGEVLHFPFVEGDRVKKGEPLLQMDKSDELRSVALADADLHSAEARLKKAESSLLLEKTRFETNLKTTQSEVETAQANLKDAGDKLKRQKDLFEQKFAARETLDSAETLFKVNREKLEQARAQLASAKDAVHDIAIKENEVELAQADLDRSKIVHDEKMERLEETEIFAPIDGVLISKLVEEGQIIASGISNVGGGTTLATIADMSRLFINADVDETDIGSVELGQRVNITTDAFLSKTYSGRVMRIAPQGKVESSITIFKVKIEILGEGKSALKPMMTANVDIITHEVPDAVYVTREGIREDGVKVYAMLLDGDRPREVPVVAGIQSPIFTQILKGLEAGQKVVLGDWEQVIKDAEEASKGGSSLRKILFMLRSR
ncbi:MAG: efflux transporter periplasmic adaptor subunit [Nitrospinae bacterium CG11_big_fil_rev_8_21_14_0_20_56_8]|nr:MAG: efflux transporter periplasmic adaptor subunit [Nitrospinae bacterium CG11_big_fil_rev_8_21_14_0_20_56_8]